MSDITITDNEYRIVNQVVISTHLRWRAVDKDDIRSELLLWVCENYKYVQRYRTEEYGTKKLSKALARHANKYAQNEYEQRKGITLRDEMHTYTRQQIRELIPYALDSSLLPVSTSNVDLGNGVHRTSDTDWMQELLPMVADIQKAIALLTPAQKQAIGFYASGKLGKDYAAELGISHGALLQRTSTAVERLYILLGEKRYLMDDNQ